MLGYQFLLLQILAQLPCLSLSEIGRLSLRRTRSFAWLMARMFHLFSLAHPVPLRMNFSWRKLNLFFFKVQTKKKTFQTMFFKGLPLTYISWLSDLSAFLAELFFWKNNLTWPTYKEVFSWVTVLSLEHRLYVWDQGNLRYNRLVCHFHCRPNCCLSLGSFINPSVGTRFVSVVSIVICTGTFQLHICNFNLLKFSNRVFSVVNCNWCLNWRSLYV